jgi:hypothetical protein
MGCHGNKPCKYTVILKATHGLHSLESLTKAIVAYRTLNDLDPLFKDADEPESLKLAGKRRQSALAGQRGRHAKEDAAAGIGASGPQTRCP